MKFIYIYYINLVKYHIYYIYIYINYIKCNYRLYSYISKYMFSNFVEYQIFVNV